MRAPEGFLLGGIKREGIGVGLIFSERRCAVAGTFTENTLRAAPVEHSEEVCDRGVARGVIVNSGHANAMTGEEGYQDVLRTAEAIAELMGAPEDEIVVCSTGVIGERPPVDKIVRYAREVWEDIGPTERHVREFSRAIMTTDTEEKIALYEGDGWSLLGIAKGAGMIHPNMSTMLAFLLTDVGAKPKELQMWLRDVVNDTFNMITVDGDESTNDSVVLLANGSSNLKVGSDVTITEFQRALEEVCTELAEKIVRDGEGATKLMIVCVHGASNEVEARRAARAIASSNLVKAALFGENPNWGRIGAAVGAARVDVDPDELRIAFRSSEGEIVTYEGGPVDFDEEKAKRVLSASEVEIVVDLGVGDASARAWGCDLTYEYVRINAEYRT
ncbi:bifunctional glutamate N-acetyltransferase/amino-acid acetyltransferase ArgJ [Methanopyrus kandleri]|uniref:Glutamate N-acetyltransferase n=2 Tax=Methanopyrus kandleri TaxID=2320 RepID=ARGJ_METKA|nr:bifunctional glutamate N-acetyltransferase/amino-acid acetyltransferase ArgJ [Methanopyrus kandleri]Q8TX15.1 RecName: Full=Arginine biosynthesis bifunctional protein ArgJ; Includes: RecName: Full=Glutamate N-acetyltransferase; AltName: Full=Ornithine acetyltransferase; Short=OATase; AltName: Full=Ornithine transacetylase; Includes: RecName: Full=Amino-acid acetyltransferase; AltName: Full=N-acetylglutamate synthase; Short=AGSase; Contains: RecName: Full=Arginine biosynthesis bifunctional protei